MKFIQRPHHLDSGLIGGERTSLAVAIAPENGPEVEQAAPEFDFTENYSKAAKLHHIRPWNWDNGPSSEGVSIDPLAQEYQDRIPEHWDDDQIRALNRADSSGEWEYLYQQFDHKNKLSEELSAHGVKGAAVELLATFTDPVAGGTLIASELLAAPWIAGTKAVTTAGILKKMAKAGAVGAASDGALSTLRSQQEADYTFADAMQNIALGTVIGAPFGLLYKGTDDAVASVADAATKRALGRVAEAIEEDAAYNLSRSMGAAEVHVPDQQSPWTSLRYDEHGKAMGSDDPAFRSAMNQMVEDGVKGGQSTVALEVDHIGKTMYSRLYRPTLEHFEDYAKAAGASKWQVLKRQELKQSFSDDVYRYIVTGQEPLDTTGAVKAVASEIRKINQELLERAKAAGVKGLDNVDPDSNYMARFWHSDKFRAALSTHQPQKVATVIYKSLFAKALANGADDIDAVHLAKIAIGFTNRMDRRVNAADKNLAEILDDEGEVSDMLREFVRVEDEADYEALLKEALSYKPKNVGGTDMIDRAKKRMDLDMNAEHEGLKILDLIDTDAVGVSHKYIASMVGHTAFANKMGVKSPSDWAATKKGMRPKEANKLEQMRSVLLGKPIWGSDYAEAQQIARTIGKLNFTSAMGKAYFASFAEFGRIVNNNGLLVALKHIPQLTTILKTIAKPTHEGAGLAREVNGFFASIGDEHLMALWGRYDDNLISDGTATQGALNSLEILAHGLSNVMAYTFAPLAPVDKALRQVAFSSNMSHLYNHLVKGANLKWDAKELSLDDTLLKDVMEEMKKHTKTGRLGEVKTLGIEKWDARTAEALMERMTRWNAKQVQRSLLGESNILQSHWLGRVFTQFRGFMLDSWTKMAKNDWYHMTNNRQLQAFGNIVWGAIFAGLQYAGRTYASSIGHPDQEAYLRERLDYTASPFDKNKGAFWANVINYHPSLGTLAAVYNTAAHAFSFDQLQVYRSTGYRSDLFANPTSEAINRAFDASAVLSSDESLEKHHLRMMATFIPFQNTVLGSALINHYLR